MYEIVNTLILYTLYNTNIQYVVLIDTYYLRQDRASPSILHSGQGNMLAAKKGREQQLKVYKAYMKGDKVSFKSHQSEQYDYATQRKDNSDPSGSDKKRTIRYCIFAFVRVCSAPPKFYTRALNCALNF